MLLVDTLEDLKEDIEHTAIVTATTRRDWIKKLNALIEQIAAADDEEDEEEEAEGDDSEGGPYDETLLSAKAVFQVAHALRRPRWQVEEDPEEAIMDLCEKVLSK